MHNIQRNTYEMLQRVDSFGADNRHLFPEGTFARQVFDTIGNVVEELSVLSVAQTNGFQLAKDRTERKTDARVALRESLTNIAQTARLITRTFPRFDEQFQIPRRLGDPSLLYTARMFAQQAAAHSEVFFRYAMRPAFIDELNLLIETVEQYNHDRANARAVHKSATAAINAALRKGMDAIQELDVLVPNTVRDDRAVFLIWQTIRRIKGIGRKKAVAASAQSA